MQCAKQFSLTVEEAVVCLTHSSTISPVSSPAFVEYDSANDRILFNNGVNMSVVNPATEAILGTIATGAGSVNSGITFAPSNGQTYFGMNGNLIGRVDASALTFGGSFGFPASVLILTGALSGDDANNRIYLPVMLNTFEQAIASIDPGTNTASVLLTTVPPVGGSDNIGARAAYNPDNNQIYVPYASIDALAVLTVFINIYSPAGALLNQVTMPSVQFSGAEHCFHCPENSLIYYIGQNLASGNFGVIILNPADNSIVTTIDYGAVEVPGWMCFTPGSANVIDSVGNFKQFDTTTHAEICATALGHSASARMASTGTKAYVADVVNNEVEVMSP